jgi:hypothetical protein
MRELRRLGCARRAQLAPCRGLWAAEYSDYKLASRFSNFSENRLFVFALAFSPPFFYFESIQSL